MAPLAATSLAAPATQAIQALDARIERMVLTDATVWRRFGIPTLPLLRGGRSAPRCLLAAAPATLRLEGKNVDSRPWHTCDWKRQLRLVLPRVAGRGTVSFTRRPSPARAIGIAPANDAMPRIDSVAERGYARFVVPMTTRRPIELPVPPVASIGNASSLEEQESPKPRWALHRVWGFAPKPIRAAILLLPLLGAGGIFFPRIEATLRGVRWQRPAVVALWQQRMESRLRARAAVEIEDNFTSGLSGWDGGPAGLGDWAYDQAGLVQPGNLAILKASRSLSNYRFEFLGQIRKKGVSWAFRASDQNNYYAMRIVITRPGPLPRIALVRYAVVRGNPGARVQVPLPLTVRNDTVYRVVTRVYHDGFITSVNGQVVDSFVDRQHPAGGVGFFGAPGEEARIIRVRVADRDDLIGKTCAYFSRLSADSW